MSKNPTAIHVVPTGDGKWTVKSEGAGRGSKRFDKQSDAVHSATERARRKENSRSEVVVHKRDGTIREKNSYGKDPKSLEKKR
jgi:hypothetical protein